MFVTVAENNESSIFACCKTLVAEKASYWAMTQAVDQQTTVPRFLSSNPLRGRNFQHFNSLLS